MEDIKFKKHTDKETEVQVLQEISIDKGLFGDIFYSIIKIKGRKRYFIIKRYKEGLADKPASRWAKEAFENYRFTKEAGSKVFPTFRIDTDEKSILMTAGFMENQTCVGSNNKVNLKELGQPPIKEIVNFNVFLSNFFKEYVKAARAGIFIGGDVPFFIINNLEIVELDFVFGDLDNIIVHQNPTKNYLPLLIESNLQTAINSLDSFIRFNVTNKELQDRLLNDSHKYYMDLKYAG